jgi:hypothetical protein
LRVVWIDGAKDTGDKRVLDFLRTALAAPPFIPGSGLLLGFPLGERKHGIAIFRNQVGGAYSFFDANFGIYTCSDLGRLFGTLALILLDGYDMPLTSATFIGSWTVYAPPELEQSARSAQVEPERSREHLAGFATTAEQFVTVLKAKRLTAVTTALHNAEWAVQRSREAKADETRKRAAYEGFRVTFRAKEFHTPADIAERDRFLKAAENAAAAYNAAEQERERLEREADQLRVAVEMSPQEARQIRAAAGPPPRAAAQAAAY